MKIVFLFLSLCLLVSRNGCDATFASVGDRLILVITESNSWDQQAIACRRNGARMVKIDSADFMYSLVQYLYRDDLTGRNYWIGATEVGHEGTFRWQDGSLMKLGTPFWGLDHGFQEPNGGNLETCVFMNSNTYYYFADALCTDYAAVICEKNEEP